MSGDPIIPGLDDEAVVGWWELYDSGLSVAEVGERANVHVAILHLALGPEGLNVLGNARLARGDKLDTGLLKRALAGELSEHEQVLYDAVARIAGEVHDDPIYPRHLDAAYALPHHMPGNSGKHSYHPMSGRQRMMDRLAPARMRKVVRANLRKSGLLGR